MTNTRADELRTMIDALHEYAIAHGGYSVVCISAKIAEPLQAELDSLEYASVEPTPEPSTPADLTTIAQPASKRFQDYMRTGVDKPSTRVDESSTAKPKCKTCGDNKTIYRMVGEHWKDVPCPDCQDKPDNEASFGLLHVDRDGDNLVFRSHDNDENVGTPCPHGAVHVNIAEDLARHICTIAKVNLHQPTIDLIVQRLHSAPERLSRNMSCTAFAILCQELRGVADDIAELEGK